MVHKKLMQARLALQSRKMNKSGQNKFAGYDYFELGDFLPHVQEIFAEFNLCGVVSYGTDTATLTITDTDDSTSLVISSPMSTAALKGCHAVQNLGAVQTYLRRYLWVTALEIVEHDAIDSSKPVTDKIVHTPTGNPVVDDKRVSIIKDVATAIITKFDEDNLYGAYEEYVQITDQEEKVALWKLLPSNVRSALKSQSAKE